jgi:prepilin-type N-terminal cleavage/methylation domain-containing protein
MLHDIKKSRGFTLVELLVATAIIGIVATISTQLLWDTVTNRSKQDSIEVSSENMRVFINNLTNYIQEADSINIPNDATIEIKANTCRTIRYNSADHNIEEAKITSDGCNAPDSTAIFSPLTQQDITINSFGLLPTGPNPSILTLTIAGTYQDLGGEHPLNIVTTITPRVTY